MHFVRYGIVSLLILTFISGCATVKESEVQLPKQQVANNTTEYSVPLSKLGDMIEATNDSDVYIAIMPIVNKIPSLGKLPDDITGMLKTAFMNIGYKVHVVYSIDALNNVNSPEKYIVEGEISEFEQVKGGGNGFNLSLSATANGNEGDMDYNNESGTEVKNIALDLRVLNALTGEYIPFVFTKNKLQIVKKTKSRSIAISIIGNGFGFSGNYTKQNGVDSSLRILSEFSTVELLGKLRSLPYWMVLPNGKPDYKVINNYKRQFRYFNKNMKEKYIIFLLRSFYPNVNYKNLKNYVRVAKKRLGLYPIDGKLTPDLFAKLLLGVTKKSIKTKIVQDRQNLLNSVLE